MRAAASFMFGLMILPACALGSTVFDLDTLAATDLYDLSSAGSHSYLRVGEAAGIPNLFYRQFSDWHPGGPLFEPVLSLVVKGEEGRRRGYTWYPDRVEAAYEYGGVVDVEETLGYVGRDVVIAQLTLLNKTDKKLTVDFAGHFSDKASGIALDDIPLGMRVTTKADMGALHNNPCTHDEEWVIRWSRPLGRFNLQGHKYWLDLALPPGERVTLLLGIARKEYEADLGAAMADPDAARRAAADGVRSWLAQAPQSGGDPQRVAWAWYWLWYNTLGAEGCWGHDIITPSKQAYARGVWLWDSGFHIMALARGGAEAVALAADQIRVLVANEIDGHLPREVWVDTPNRELQAPGILTWAAMEVYSVQGDWKLLDEIYPALCRNNRWFYENRDSNGNGLAEWAGGDSGWDCSPRWDGGPVDAVDLNAWLTLDQKKLSEMAAKLGKPEESRAWAKRAEETRALLLTLWDEEDGCFYDLALDGTGFYKVGTPANFWPLYVGAPAQKQAERLAVLVKDESKFWTNWPLPAVAIDEERYDPRSYWRGPTWIHINWIVARGFRLYGFTEIADEIEARSIGVIERSPSPHEYYHAETGEPLGARNYMWTAALYVVMTDEAAIRKGR